MYILSLKHTAPNDDFITLWRGNNSGYCYNKKDAGKYNKPKKGYHDSLDDMPVTVSTFNRLSITTVQGVRLPNCKAVHNELGLKKGKHQILRIQKLSLSLIQS